MLLDQVEPELGYSIAERLALETTAFYLGDIGVAQFSAQQVEEISLRVVSIFEIGSATQVGQARENHLPEALWLSKHVRAGE